MAEERDRKPWERQKGEPQKFFTRFRVYRDMGPGRSVRLACEIKRLPGNVQKGTYHTWATYASRWNWYQRAKAWDDWREEEAQRAADAKAVQMAIDEAEHLAKEQVLMRQEGEALRTVARLLTLRILEVVRNPETLKQIGIRRRKDRSGNKFSFTEEITPGVLDLVKLAAEGLDVGGKLYRMALGEVTDRTATETRVKGEDAVAQMVAALEAYFGDGAPDLPTLGVLQDRLLAGDGEGNGNGGA